MQGGSGGDTLLADSFVKSIKKGIDWDEGLKAMLKDAEVVSPDWGLMGRGGIEARNRLGFIPSNRNGSGDAPWGPAVTPGRSVSRLLEYAYNDFSIALVAAGLGKRDLFDKYLEKSKDWKNVWRDDLESDGFKGFLQPRFENGSFDYQDPRRCSPAYQFGTCYLKLEQDTAFYEASAWQYSFWNPAQMSDVVELMGGDEVYLDRHDHLWDQMYGDIGDEPGFLPAYASNYAVGGYRRTVDRVLNTYRTFFNTSLNGLPGNDDSGK